ncbi:MAG TPA: TMEM175 family protein [Gemmatimonadota bacterium]|nr:TMEM175 family protein [Gemmatimonadota bacterium]
MPPQKDPGPEVSAAEDFGVSSGARVATLVDGVFAIVMTLLVLVIDPPRVPREELDETLVREVLRLWPRIAAFGVSFIVLGIYWMGHHTQFRFLRRVDLGLLWVNLLFLMAVCLVPFTTHLVGHYGSEGIGLWLYGCNFILISLLLLAHWRYAAWRGLLREEADGDLVPLATRQILVGPALYLAAIAVSFLDPRLSLLVILAVPVLHVLPGPFHLHWTR